jgi:type I restriction enzyme S subunit
MMQRTLIRAFDQLADAPGGVAKLRELVLQLAVRGQLVDAQNADTSWQAQVLADKSRGINGQKLKRHPVTTDRADEDLPFHLPSHWLPMRLGDLVYSCPTSYGENPTSELPTAGVITVGNIDNSSFFKGNFSPRSFPADEFSELVARAGDLVVVKSSGSAENVHSGKTALCRTEHDGKIVGSNFVMRLRAFGDSVLPEYLWRVMSSRTSRAWVEKTVQTMTYPNLKWSDYAQLPIGLPSPAEQARIVAKVDELMALCDALEARQTTRNEARRRLHAATLHHVTGARSPSELAANWSRLRTHFDPLHATPDSIHALRQTVLQLAIQGRLATQNAADNAPPEAERAGDWEPEDLYPLPVKWQWYRLDQIGEWAIGGGFPTAEQGHTDRPILFAKVSDMNLPGNEKWIRTANNSIDEATAKRLRVKVHPPGTVIFPKIGGAIATNKRRITTKPTAIDNNCLGLIPRKVCGTDWLFLLLTGLYFAQYQSGTSVPALSQGTLGAITVGLPPLAEQERIVAKAEELLALCDELETRLKDADARRERLLTAAIHDVLSAVRC